METKRTSSSRAIQNAQISQRPTQVAPTKAQVVGGLGLIKKGQSGPPVKDLQKELEARGYNVGPLDGKFGPKTEAAVRAFQRDMKAQDPNFMVDGLVGPQTIGALEKARGGTVETKPETQERLAQGQTIGTSTPLAPAPDTGETQAPPGTVSAGRLAKADEARQAQGSFRTDRAFAQTREGREAQAQQLLRQNGVTIEPGRTYALQIDQEAPKEGSTQDYLKSYSGQTGVFKADENGRLQEVGGPFRSASHPSGVGGRNMDNLDPRVGYQDVDRDGRSDIAHLQPGVYEYRNRTSGRNRYNMTDTNVAVHRDTNHDGRIDAGEKQDWHNATGIQIHAGGSNRPSSAGCQTMPPSDYRGFQDAIRQSSGNDNSFTYVSIHRPYTGR